MTVKYECDLCGKPATVRVCMDVMLVSLCDKPTVQTRQQGEFCAEHAQDAIKASAEKFAP